MKKSGLGAVSVLAFLFVSMCPLAAGSESAPLPAAMSTASVKSPAPMADNPNPRAAEIRAIQASYHVSNEQAEHNLAVQHRGTKINVVDQLELALDGEFAGVWFDNEAGEFVVPVAVAGFPEAAIQNRKAVVRAEFAAAALDGAYRTVEVEHSRSELEVAQAKLDRSLEPFFEGQVLQTALDPAANAVVVRIAAGADDATMKEIQSAVADAGVKVEVREAPDAFFKVGRNGCNEAMRLCDLPVRGGAFIYPGPYWLNGQEVTNICTAAFRANGWDGRKYILTAGHCVLENGKPGGAPIWSTFTVDTALQRHTIGTTSQWHWPGKDWAKIDATGSWADTPPWPTVLAYWGGPHEYPIVGEAKSYKGQTLCHVGANTGTSCGIVREANVTVQYSGGEQLNSMFEVGGKGLCQGGGDSGGPWVASNIALGIHSGGNSHCYNEFATAFFSDIMAANAELQVNIAGPGAPEAITGSASNVQPTQATVSGQVNPRGLQASYRFEYGKGAFTHSTPDQSAGAGQGFVSTSATLGGLDPYATYKYRIRAANSLNTAYGAEGTFNTPPVPPVVSTLPAINITGSSATLRATINPEGAPTTYYFEYGLSPGFGFKTAEFSVGTGRTPATRTVSVSGLEFGENYYFRVVANSIGGTSAGNTRSFTPGWLATPAVQIPSGLEPPFQQPSVDCPAVHSCVAVVTGAGPSEYLQTFASSYNGAKWSSTKIPQPIVGGDRSHFPDISCVSPTNCRAVGWAREPSTGLLKAAVAQWDGSVWQSATIPAPSGAAMVIPESIACPTTTDCMAVGTYIDTVGWRKELALKWDGTSWTYLPSPSSEGLSNAKIPSVDCASASSCYATGFLRRTNGETVVFANRWNGIAWTREVLETYVGSEQNQRLYKASCAGASLCVAGGVTMSGGKAVPWFAKTSGAGWTLTALSGIPLTTDKYSAFSSVECASEVLCEGVGYVEDASGELLPLAARLREGTWQRQILPALANGRSTLTDLSCVSPTYCMAVGTRESYPLTAPIAGRYAK